MENDINENLYRKYIDGALASLRKEQSKQTKLIHREAPYQAVSLQENLLFCLLLLRKKQHEEMLEAKKLLSRLLSFQNGDALSPDYGSFPTDLTDFPACNERALPVRVAYILEILTRDFGHILGGELSEKVHTSLTRALSYVKNNEMLLSFPEKWYANHLLRQEHMCYGDDCCTVEHAGKILATFDYFGFSEEFLHRAFTFWDEKSAMYCGPAFFVPQYGTEKMCSLFDCWMSVHTGIPLKRPWSRDALLELALVKPGKALKPQTCWIETSEYVVYRMPEGVLAASFVTPKPHRARDFFPLSFVSHGVTAVWRFPQGKLVSLRRDGNGFYGVVERIRPEEPLLYELFAERKAQVSVPGGTLFDPFQGKELHVGASLLKSSLEACADCIGMVSMGNRSSQKMGTELDAYDWIVSYESTKGNIETFSFRLQVDPYPS